METLYIENIIGKRLYQDQGKQDIKTLIVSSHQPISKGIV